MYEVPGVCPAVRKLKTTVTSQVSIAIISDPCFGPGMCWPQRSGYEFFGERSVRNNTVALLISTDFLDKVSVLAQVGDARAMWLHVHIPVGNARGFLLLATYAPPPNRSPLERREFFEARAADLQKLRTERLFSSLPVILAGDLNIHIAELCDKNARLERPVDREISAMIVSTVGMNLALRNPSQIATHDSGSAIDLVFSSHEITPVVEVLPKTEFLFSSDHRPLLITDVGSIPHAERQTFGKAKCPPSSDAWNEALLHVPLCLEYFCTWARMILRENLLRDSLVDGKWQRLRQAVVDRAVWWRSVVLCLAGHMCGLAVTVKPHSSTYGSQAFQLEKFLLEWYGPQCLSNTIEYEEFVSQVGRAGSPSLVRHFLDSHATDPSRAQALLSMMLNPRVATEVNFVDEASGRRASDSTVVQLLTQEILERPSQAHPGIDTFTEVVHEALQAERETARQEAATEPHMFFAFDDVKRWVSDISQHKASLRFPRAALVNENPLGLELCWLLLNLFMALGVVPSAWMREVSFIRKRGPQVVIGYTDELQTLFDLAWLHSCRHLLETYIGQEQAGGRFDSTLVSLGILIALQTRRNWSLPTFCLKADLLQGYDLAWKSAMLLHTRWAGIRGSLWLCLDSAVQQDHFRIRYGPLVGPAILLITAGLGQGGRRAVHLFGALARGIPDQLRQSVIGVSLGTSPILLDRLRLHSRPSGDVEVNIVPYLVQACRGTAPLSHSSTLLRSTNLETALVALDVLATHSLLVFQFVDDVFVFQSTLWGMNRVCKALEQFLQLWKHRFAAGPSKVALMLVPASLPSSTNLPSLDGAAIGLVSSFNVHLTAILASPTCLKSRALVLYRKPPSSVSPYVI